MPIKRPALIINEIYHIVLRGVEKRIIFLNDSDSFRCIFSLYEFNDNKPVSIRDRRKARLLQKSREQFSGDLKDKRELLVEILAFCLMPNHIHLLIRPIQENGVSKFMRKFGAGYATYFNKKYNRVGHLFQGRFKAVHIKNEDQLKHVFVYIHTNPAELIDAGWKERSIKNPKEVINYLNNYKWSSYLDYIGGKSFPSLTKRDFLSEIFEGKFGCKSFVENWVLYKGQIKALGEVVLE